MIYSETYPVDDHRVEAHHTVSANGETLVLLRPEGAEAEVLIGGHSGYSLQGARNLRDALTALIEHADAR